MLEPEDQKTLERVATYTSHVCRLFHSDAGALARAIIDIQKQLEQEAGHKKDREEHL